MEDKSKRRGMKRKAPDSPVTSQTTNHSSTDKPVNVTGVPDEIAPVPPEVLPEPRELSPRRGNLLAAGVDRFHEAPEKVNNGIDPRSFFLVYL